MKIKLRFAPKDSFCAMCLIHTLPLNKLIVCEFTKPGEKSWQHVYLHTPCMGVFLVHNTHLVLRVMP